MIPDHLKYTPTHEWFLFKNKSITVGITRFIVDELKKLLYLDLPKVGDEILAGISFGEIESLELLMDITSPINGEIVEVNERLFENLDILNNDPYDKGWLVKFVSAEKQPFQGFLSAQEYAEHIAKMRSTSLPKQRKRHGKVVRRRTRR